MWSSCLHNNHDLSHCGRDQCIIDDKGSTQIWLSRTDHFLPIALINTLIIILFCMDLLMATSQIAIKDCKLCNASLQSKPYVIHCWFTRCPRASPLQNSQRNSMVLLSCPCHVRSDQCRWLHPLSLSIETLCILFFNSNYHRLASCFMDSFTRRLDI